MVFYIEIYVDFSKENLCQGNYKKKKNTVPHCFVNIVKFHIPAQPIDSVDWLVMSIKITCDNIKVGNTTFVILY